MKHRNIMAVILLSIFTLGIYDLIWLVKVKKELNAKTDVHTPSLWLLAAPYIFMVVGLIVAVALTAGDSATESGSTSAVTALTLLVYMVSIFAIIPITFYWFFKFSKAVGRYTGGQMSTALSFILLWLLRFVGIAVIQDHFNDMIAGTVPTTPVSPVQPTTQPPIMDALPAPQAQEHTPAPQPSHDHSQHTPPANPIS